MNPVIKQQWLDALRSGEYVQGRGQLNYIGSTDSGEKVEKLCCLGVLCEIAVKAGIVERRQIDDDFYYGSPAEWQTFIDRADSGDVRSVVPPESVRQWAGLDAADPPISNPWNVSYYAYADGRTPISYANDTQCRSFADIADVIEQQF